MSGARPRSIVSIAAVGVLAAGLLAATPAPAASLGPFSCLGANGLSASNPVDQVMKGYVTIPGYKTVYVGTTGNINWTVNPFNNGSWQRWFHSLLWLDPSIKNYMSTGNTTVRDRVDAIIADWAHDNPTSGGGPGWVGQIAGYRATILVCLANAIGLHPWLSTIAATHGAWLADPTHYAGAWNQGLDENIGLLGIACKTGRSDWASIAAGRMGNDIGQSIDSQGAPNEQAPGYSTYLYSRWTLAAAKIAECGLTVPTSIATRTQLLTTFIAHATQPDGAMVQIGDTYALPPGSIPGTPAEYAATRGASGSPPPDLVKIYSYQGYVFGRTAWDPFGNANFYSIHFGPGRNFHGHNDHMSITYMWAGKPVLVDSGHDNYTLDAYREYLRAPEGHNMLTVKGGRVNGYGTSMTRYAVHPTYQFYELSDKVYTGVTRVRDILVANSGFVVVLDRASTSSIVGFRQLWHMATGSTLMSLSRSAARFRSGDGSMQVLVGSLPFPGETLPAGATGVVSGQTSPYLGWVSRTMGSRIPDPTVVMGRNASSVRMLTVIVPAASGVTTSLSSVTKYGTGWVFTVRVGSVTTPVFVSAGASLYL